MATTILNEMEKVSVSYKGNDGILTRSNIFAVENIVGQTEAKVLGSGSQIVLITYFLVWMNGKRRSLWWVPMENCDVELMLFPPEKK